MNRRRELYADAAMSVLARRYHLERVIGEGAYGVVAAAVDGHTGERVAVKRIRRVLESYAMATRMLRELKFLRLLRDCENVVQVRDVLAPSDAKVFNDAFVVLELLPLDLGAAVRRKALNPENVKFLMWGLLKGICYLHDAGVVHRDLKPANVLVNETCQVKICDFGLARAVMRTGAADGDLQALWTDYVATRYYRAPELVFPRERSYGTAIDMWSAGCIFAEMILGEPLFPGTDAFDQFRRIIAVTGTPGAAAVADIRSRDACDLVRSLEPTPRANFAELFPPGTDPGAVRVISAMLEFDPEKRITAKDALKDAYFALYTATRGLGPRALPIGEHEFDFEKALNLKDPAGLDDIRRAFIEEILVYHPEKRNELLGASSTAPVLDLDTEADTFGNDLNRELQNAALRRSRNAKTLPRTVPGNSAQLQDARMVKMSTMPISELESDARMGE